MSVADIQRTNAKRDFCSARVFLARVAAISRQTWRKAERGEASFVDVCSILVIAFAHVIAPFS
jgi:hypothetical protein